MYNVYKVVKIGGGVVNTFDANKLPLGPDQANAEAQEAAIKMCRQWNENAYHMGPFRVDTFRR